MNAPIAKDQFTYSLGNLTYVDSSYDEVSAPAQKQPKHGLGGWLSARLEALGQWRQRRAVMEEMTLMTDRELSDIGLSRADLPRVFEPDFAADHARGRGYIAF
ncbi:MAG: DUF1127 domain-containing protein [Acetobacteraceae bacterium]